MGEGVRVGATQGFGFYLVGAPVWGQRLRSEARSSGTFTTLAISSQPEARGTGTAVGAERVLTRVLTQAARGGPALIHICRWVAGTGWVAPAPSSPGERGYMGREIQKPRRDREKPGQRKGRQKDQRQQEYRREA